ncbi:MAG: hypothetical protein K0R50_509 [Eubacterium sp.]|nr:hypothetical protein [Eubacterium sp.]
MKKNNPKDEWKVIRFIIIVFNKIAAFFKYFIGAINKNREGKYSPFIIGMGAGLLSLILLVIMLFVPPFLGMSDDGSFSRVINPVGIYHREDTSENLYFNYYVKDYLSLAPQEKSFSNPTGLRMLVNAAKWVDEAFTRDSIFDLRFLAVFYSLLYIAAIVILIKQASKRAETFTESVAIGLAGVLIFSDVSYLAYFSSFFLEPLLFIAVLFCTGAALGLQNEKNNTFYLIVYTFFGIVITTMEKEYALTGIFLGILGVKFVFIGKSFLWKAGCFTSVLLLFLSVMVSLAYSPDSFTQSSKYHAMTRGVLLQATDPDKTLKEFGIDGSYSILTDTNANEQYPLLNPDNAALQNGFYDRYNVAEISYYYLRHPKSMIAMLDISVKAAFNIRRDYSGNYEKSAGMPKMAKSLTWSFWSNFKTNSAPKTIGFLVVMLVAVFILFRQKSVRIINYYRQRNSIPLETMLIIFFIGLSNAIVAIVNSGDAEMTQHLFLFSVSIDILIYFCFAEVLHKLRIL